MDSPIGQAQHATGARFVPLGELDVHLSVTETYDFGKLIPIDGSTIIRLPFLTHYFTIISSSQHEFSIHVISVASRRANGYRT